MRARPGETPQKAGSRFEKFWASLFGVKPKRGSGNQWFSKLDVGDGSITWSCKWTTHESFSVSKKLMREAEEGIYKNGDDSIPGIATAIDNGTEVFVTLRASDFLRIVSSDAATFVTPSKADQKRAIASVPGLLRDAQN